MMLATVFFYMLYLHTSGMKTLTAVLEKEGSGYISLCPEIDVASQGDTVEEALANLRKAVELFLETADAAEITNRLHAPIATRFAS